MELDEVYATERQLLYVAATRARDRLLISGVRPASEFLANLHIAPSSMSSDYAYTADDVIMRPLGYGDRSASHKTNYSRRMTTHCPFLVDLGYEGPDAYATDENGNFIVEAVRRPNFKMIRFLLEWALPEKWGKHRKSDIPRTGGVLVIGERTKEPENSCAATIKARQWKSRSREIEKAKS